MKEKNYSRQTFYILMFFLVVLLGVLGKVLSSVVLPVLVSILFSFIIYPAIKKANSKFKIPWALGTILMVFLIVIIFIIISTLVGKSITAFLNQYSKYENKFLFLYKVFADTFNITFYDDKNFMQNIWSQLKIREVLQQLALFLSGNIFSFVKSFGLTLLFTVFLVLELKFGKEKVYAMVQGKLQGRVEGMIKKTISDTARFLTIKFFVSLATGLLVFLMCLCLGLDFAPMWAFLAFILNFIPTFGSIFSVLMMTLFATLQFYPSPVRIILVFLITLTINFVIGNIIEPRIVGKNLGVSPFVILVALTFWGWMWGFIGMIIAVPVMVIIKIVCENVSYLHPIAILIGNHPEDTLQELQQDEEEEEE